jgi:hypothetical protein
MATSPTRSSVPSTWSPLQAVYERTLRYLNANLTQVHHLLYGKLRICLYLYLKKIKFFYFLILSYFFILLLNYHIFLVQKIMT